MLPTPALPQKKKAPARRPAAPAKPPAPDLSAVAAQAAEQLKVLTQFIYLYGKVSNGLELEADQAKQGASSAALQEKSKKMRESLVASVSGLRMGVENLAQSFHDNPRLQTQYLKVLNASEAIASAERSVSDGRFDEAGKALVAAAWRLADAVAAVR